MLNPTIPPGLNRHPPTEKEDGNMNRDYLLLTGATGHIGNYLLKDLSIKQQPVAVLVRDK